MVPPTANSKQPSSGYIVPRRPTRRFDSASKLPYGVRDLQRYQEYLIKVRKQLLKSLPKTHALYMRSDQDTGILKTDQPVSTPYGRISDADLVKKKKKKFPGEKCKQSLAHYPFRRTHRETMWSEVREAENQPRKEIKPKPSEADQARWVELARSRAQRDADWTRKTLKEKD